MSEAFIRYKQRKAVLATVSRETIAALKKDLPLMFGTWMIFAALAVIGVYMPFIDLPVTMTDSAMEDD
jgi:hypothetical protein